jgi:c-type cytochrome biogenesis protein CcmF
VLVHAVLLTAAGFTLPVGLPDGWTPPVDRSPIASLVVALTAGVGAPLLMLSATAPLLQKWFSSTDDAAAADPYFLYAASNFGSILALLAYPFVIEPFSSLWTQTARWSLGYGILVALTLACGFAAFRRLAPVCASALGPDSAEPLSFRRRARWLALAFVPSSLILATTTYLATDVGSVPLLWTIPLALYLLSFIIGFAARKLVTDSFARGPASIAVVILIFVFATELTKPVALLLGLHLAVLFCVALALHSALAHDRPSTARLTEFYLWIAIGGVAGGAFNTLAAPMLFTSVMEYPLALAAAFAVILGTLYPLAIEAMGLGKMSVGPPFFNLVFPILTFPLLILVGLAASVPWKRASLRDTLRAVRAHASAALVAGVLLPLLLQGRWSWIAAAGTVLALWTLVTAGQEVWRRVRARANWAEGLASIPRAIWGMSLAHFGIGVFVLGVTHVSMFGAERDVRLAPGSSESLGRYEFQLVDVKHQSGPNYEADVGTVIVEADGRPIAALRPEKRLYRVQQNVMTEAAVDASLLRDVYVALGDGFDNGDWGLRLYYRPMMRLVWLGGVLAFLGGLLALSDRRYRLAQAAASARDSTATATA